MRQRSSAFAARTALGIAVAVLAAGCARAPAQPAATPTPRTAPDLAGFLRLPVASPATCPPGRNGTTSGRTSPWVGHVDISVFVDRRADPATVRRLGQTLRAFPDVAEVYAESAAQARAEFARLYTCSARVPAAAVPPSYRLALHAVTQGVRDDLVRTILGLAGVADVSCDPSNPCVDVVREARLGATP